MGIFGRNIEQTYGSRAALPLVTPFSSQDSLERILVDDLYPEHDEPVALTRETALRIPAVKRSHDIICSILARTPWRQYDGDAEVTDQPGWLVNSGSGVGPRALRWGVASDLFMNGWAAIGFAMDGETINDALHLPFGWWEVAADGTVKVSDQKLGLVPARYTHRIVAIPLGYGSSGMLVDARTSMHGARAIEAAYVDRVENPIPATDIELSKEYWNAWGKEERESFRRNYIKNRQAKNGAVSLRPEYAKPNYSGGVETNLFESARNGVRLDIANHAGIPASLLEGSRQGGGTDIKYSGVNNGADRNELWDFGLDKYASAIEDRLSLDDVCPSGESIRVDASRYLSVPQPTNPQTSED
ncbi:hypothetical protein [Microbacterium sp. Leaf179]|uniref:hypothetical protein n=1 Tax=Microbacterium sp. Leaf179 TaxID=1736288 RepID=UPI0006FFFA81|nr:hypothetical protein [Microbacterium sp. Leaf179]KQR86835.1 hypothetical protein ASF96_11010 [Microbacterium sp. Leaf179]